MTYKERGPVVCMYPANIEDKHVIDMLKELKAQTIPLRYREAIEIAIDCVTKDYDGTPVLCTDTYRFWYECPSCGSVLKRKISCLKDGSLIKKEDRRTYERCRICGQAILWDKTKMITI